MMFLHGTFDPVQQMTHEAGLPARLRELAISVREHAYGHRHE
jgi:hypothetical protein